MAEHDDDEPVIRQSFRGPAAREALPRHVTTEQAKALPDYAKVISEGGRAYKGVNATGQLIQLDGSDRVARRAGGISGRQWKKQARARRRAASAGRS